MHRTEFVTHMRWLELAARRANIRFSLTGELPEVGSELLFWGHYLAELNRLAKQTGCPHIGLLLGREAHYQELGNHGYVLTNAARTVQHLLELMSDYSRVRHSVSHYEFRPLKRSGQLHFRPVQSLPICHVESDLALAGFVQLVRSYLGTTWTPVKTHMCRPRPVNMEPYRELFGNGICFDRKHDFIEIGSGDLQVRINDADPLLSKALLDYAQALFRDAVKSRRDISAQVKLHLLNNLGVNDVSQKTIAGSMNISRATLQRRLEAEQTSFRTLRNEVIGHLAKKYLSESSTPISVIAHQLGFSTPASFTRAFLALEGITPNAYRKQRGDLV
ncbi:MAG: AraC family transcriptional regulator ligand-binding domain-containing protein [Desulfuromonadales bacterium]|jgi:AraC-like DNA-binding protein